ncbi:MAG: hypothetical protein GAK30_00738 [Paracidovorax wautersii]|uniref:Intracellular septation protein A n=1 Tax=Paracidovorax wautersii TaxID=1177982 RepID=A0A7V8FR51_9BURK|nr:MAG: hypothetical protein GAK30_00738 [Paracidovorax wautersii]
MRSCDCKTQPEAALKRLMSVCLLLAGVAYPLLVYASLGQVQPRGLLLVLAGLWLLRALWPGQAAGGWRLPAIAVLVCLALALFNDALGLRWYPVLVNMGFLVVFASSLVTGPSVIERLARLKEPGLSGAGQRYTRRVTQVWCVFLAINGLMAGALAVWADWYWWTLYNGLLSYVAMGVLLGGEWLLRPHARRRMEAKA